MAAQRDLINETWVSRPLATPKTIPADEVLFGKLKGGGHVRVVLVKDEAVAGVLETIVDGVKRYLANIHRYAPEKAAERLAAFEAAALAAGSRA